MSEQLHPEEAVTTFWLVRHGDTQATEEGRLYTDPNAPLTQRGEGQARALAHWFAETKPEVLLTSPALRVRTTCDIIAEELKVVPVVVDGLDEWRVGAWEGRTYLDIKRRDRKAYDSWVADPITNAPPGGESIADLCIRARSYLRELAERYQGSKVALVTHAGIIRGMLVDCLGMPVENFWRLAVSTGSIARVDMSRTFSTLKCANLQPGANGLSG